MENENRTGPNEEHRQKMWVIFHDRCTQALDQVEEVGRWDVTEAEAQLLDWWLHFHEYCHAIAEREGWTVYARCQRPQFQRVVIDEVVRRAFWGTV